MIQGVFEPMKRILLIASLFPPIAATGVMRPLNFCRDLPSYGWLQRVEANDPHSVVPAQGCDRELAGNIPAEIEVVQVSHGNTLVRMLAMRDRLSHTFRRGAISTAKRTAKNP